MSGTAHRLEDRWPLPDLTATRDALLAAYADPGRRYHDTRHLAEVLDRLDELVLKPVDGYGGRGIVIGPQADRAELAALADTVRADPVAWVAQDLMRLSTHPTFANSRLEPRAVDLRVFVLQSRVGGDRTDVDALPAALTRVAPTGSLIVNSSRGGGAKDTWILR